MRLELPKFGLTAALLLWGAFSAWSMPALEKSYTVKQPDGTSIQVQNKGNERFHYVESEDGYPMIRDSQGFLRYADENGKPSTSRPRSKEKVIKQLKNKRSAVIDPEEQPQIVEDSSDVPAPRQMPSVDPNFKSGEKNALVVLVQFSDDKFSSEDPQAAFDSLLNQEGYNLEGNLGSVRDYFVTNSMGVFKPHFDVVGPVTISGSHYKNYGEQSPYKTYGAQYALKEALDSLKKSGFDFTPYDNDGDKALDFVHMIYAGLGAHDSGQDSAIWPHKWIFKTPYQISVTTANNRRSTRYIYQYSCNSELDGYTYQNNPNTKKLFGVGNFIHEFSHQLNLPDMYASDDKLFTPYVWDVMDMGAYNAISQNGPLGTSPPYFSAFERLTLGWTTVADLNIKGTVKLSGIQNNVALRVPNPKNKDEFFLLEYRSNSGWDKALPNHGLLVWHIDYKDDAWDSAYVNTTSHQHVDIEEADGVGSYASLKGDVFPGSSRINSFKKFITWDSTDLNTSISNISESRSYSYITFDVDMDADTGSISLMEGVAEDIVELSSSSEEEESSESSSSVAVVISSSSESVASSSSVIATEPVAESSSSAAEVSSSNEAVSSSSATTTEPSAESSSSTEAKSSSSLHIEVTGISTPQIKQAQFIYEGNNVIIHAAAPGSKTFQIFSLNGQLLFSETFFDESLTICLKQYKQPLLLSVNQGGKVLNRSLFIFRE